MSAAAKRPPASGAAGHPAPHLGGAERGTIDLAGALAASGWTAYVASCGGPMEHQLTRLGVRHLTLPLASKNPLVMRRNTAALIQIIRGCKIDIVHAAAGPLPGVPGRRRVHAPALRDGRFTTRTTPICR